MNYIDVKNFRKYEKLFGDNGPAKIGHVNAVIKALNEATSGGGSAYKVYTALLTQSGGDDPLNIDEGLLTIGVTYRINNDSPGMDFTNVGAPNNNINTSFVASGTTPASWGINEGTGNVTLVYNSGAPVVTVLENTIGNIWFTYINDGFYKLNSTNSFLLEKTFCQGTNETAEDGTLLVVTTVRRSSINSVDIYSTNPINEAAYNNVLNNTPIEIRVYY